MGNKEYYVGLDISLKETSICVMDGQGNITCEGSAESCPDAIGEWLSSRKLAFRKIGLEAGELSSWLVEGLRDQGFEVVCMEAYHTRAALKAQGNKTDRNDAKGIAHLIRTGWYKEVRIKAIDHRRYRVLLNARKSLLSKKQDINNTIRASLKTFGIKLGQVGRDGFEGRVREVIEDDESLQRYIEPLLNVRRVLIEQFNLLHEELLSIVRVDPICRMWMEIPGVGPVSALAYKTAIDDPGRFKKSRQVGAYLGLTPRIYSSGERERSGHITKGGDGLTRTVLFEAAQVLMTRTKRDFPLKRWGLAIARRSTLKNAITAIARKLAVMMHAMWRDGTCFDQPVINMTKRYT